MAAGVGAMRELSMWREAAWCKAIAFEKEAGQLHRGEDEVW